MRYIVNGLATPADYRHYTGDCPFSQTIIETEISLLEECPDISEIHQITVKPTFQEIRPIKHSAHPKLLLWGKFDFLLQYTTTDRASSVHTCSFDHHFQMFVEIPHSELQPDLTLLIEDLRIQQVHCRKVKLFLLVFAYAYCRD